MKRLPATVIALGVVSLLTDVSSEMIYPLLPAFLVGIGASGTMVGLIEGTAETTSAFMKLASGVWADRVRRLKPLVVAGYALAAVVRPLVALARAPVHVLAIRFADRLGKGIRTSPRDALIAHVTPDDRRGVAYGFHRAMDHAGALVGPLVAYALLAAGLAERPIFALAAIPGAAAVAVLIAAVHERDIPGRSEAAPRPSPAAAAAPRLPRPLKIYLGIVALFTLSNSTDAFLLLRAQDAGLSLEDIPLLWALHHAVKSALSTPLGALSDRLGRRFVIAAGWVVYAGTYAGFAVVRAGWAIWLLFAIYGAYFAFVEGTEKALVADLAPAAARGRAFGAFHFVVGLCALPASVLFGLIWQHVGHRAAFVFGAALAALATVLLLALLRPPGARQH